MKHIRSAPYHPSSNGAAERFVQAFKRAMKASDRSNTSFNHRLNSFPLSYRSTPHSTTNVTPCSLFLGRQVQTRLTLLQPGVEERVLGKQADQKSQHDSHAKLREFFPGQRVMARNIRAGQAWIPGTVIERTGPLSYVVQVAGKLWKRHIDHLREMGDTPVQEPVIPLQQDVATPRVTRPEESFSRVEAETATSLPTTETGNNGLEETQAPNQVTPDAASTEDSLV